MNQWMDDYDDVEHEAWKLLMRNPVMRSLCCYFMNSRNFRYICYIEFSEKISSFIDDLISMLKANFRFLFRQN